MHFQALLVKFADHVLHGSPGKGRLARLPVAIVVEPAVVERGPVDAELFQLGNGVEHLLGRHGKVVAPAAPAHGVIFVIVCGLREAFLLEEVRPRVEGLVKVAGIDGEEGARCGERLVRLQHGVRRDAHCRGDLAMFFRLYRQRDDQGQRLDVADSFAHVLRPERHDWNAPAYVTQIVFHRHRGAERIFFRIFGGHGENFVLAPLQTGAVEAPERLCGGRVGGRREGVTLQGYAVQCDVLIRRVAKRCGEERELREGVVDFEGDGLFQAGAGNLARDYYLLAERPQFARRFLDFRMSEIQLQPREVLFRNRNRLARVRSTDIQR